MPKIVIIGDILVDVTLQTSESPLKMRLGGITHAARALWSLGIPYSVGYFAPSYLDQQIIEYLDKHACHEVIKLGDVIGSPYVFLISDAKETGDQGYEFLLRDDVAVHYNKESIKQIADNNYDDYFFITGNYSAEDIIKQIDKNIHIDIANNTDDLSYFQKLSRKLNTVFISTSSKIFQQLYNNDFPEFYNQFEAFADTLVLKENRGGSRGYNFVNKQEFSGSAQTGDIVHSVGVGDVFDIFFVVNQSKLGDTQSIALASWGAFEYAYTTFVDDFKNNIERLLRLDILDLMKLKGNLLPWENRKAISIYLAAPDFDFVDTSQIDFLEQSLKYHNFSPRRPVKENGQMDNDASKQRRQELFSKDMDMLNGATILIAILLYDDPGTLIEIGLAVAKGIPTLVYDPYNKATNCMLTEVPLLLTDDPDKILNEVFTIGSNLNCND